MLYNLLYDQATFDGIHFFNNYIQIGTFKIMFYALCIMLGMIVCIFASRPMFRKINLNPDIVLDLMIVIIPVCIVTARLWYVINQIDEFETFGDVFNIRNGGLAIIGGVMGGALAVFIVTKVKKIRFLYVADIACILLPLGQAIGRWGNFFNMEVYGAKSQFNFFPFAVYIGTAASGEWHVPLFLIEGLLNLCIFVAMTIFFMKRKNYTPGYTMSFYFIGYGLIRAILEPLRDAKYNLTGVNGSGVLTQQLTSILVVMLGVVCLLFFLYRDRKLFFKNVGDSKVCNYVVFGVEVAICIAGLVLLLVTWSAKTWLVIVLACIFPVLAYGVVYHLYPRYVEFKEKIKKKKVVEKDGKEGNQ